MLEGVLCQGRVCLEVWEGCWGGWQLGRVLLLRGSQHVWSDGRSQEVAGPSVSESVGEDVEMCLEESGM